MGGKISGCETLTSGDPGGIGDTEGGVRGEEGGDALIGGGGGGRRRGRGGGCGSVGGGRGWRKGRERGEPLEVVWFGVL